MSFELPSAGRTRQGRPSWSGMAVLVEAMILLAFLMASLAVVTQLFAAASVRAREGRDLAQAVSMATSAAERFAASPASGSSTREEGELTLTCTVTPEATATGTLYHAQISVSESATGEVVYELTSARFGGEER